MMRIGHGRAWAFGAALAAAVLVGGVGAAGSASAQIGPRPPRPMPPQPPQPGPLPPFPGPGGDDGPPVPPGLDDPQKRIWVNLDREFQTRLNRADERATRGDWAAAVKAFQEIIENEKSGALLTEDPRVEGSLTSARERARRRLLALPDDGLVAYRLLVDQRALALLSAAREAGATAPLEELVERYPAATAAPEARALLSKWLFEEGRYADAAAACIELLEPVGGADEAQGAEGGGGTEAEARARNAVLWARLAVCSAAIGHVEATERALGRVGELALDAGLGESARARAERVGRRWRAGISSGGDRPALQGLAWEHRIRDYYDEPGAAQPLYEPISDGQTVWFHDGARAAALDLDTGKVLWRTTFVDGHDYYLRPHARCAAALDRGRFFVLREGRELFAFDAVDGRLLWRTDVEKVRKATGYEFTAHFVDRIAVAAGSLVLGMVSEGADREYSVIALDTEDGAPAWRTFLASEANAPAGPMEIAALAGQIVAVTGNGVVAALAPRGGSVRWLREHAHVPPVTPRRSLVGVGADGIHVLPGDGPEVLVLDPRTGALTGGYGADPEPTPPRSWPVRTTAGGPVLALATPLAFADGGLVVVRPAGLLHVGPDGSRWLAPLPEGASGWLGTGARPSIHDGLLALPTRRGLTVVEVATGEVQSFALPTKASAGDVIAVGGRVVASCGDGLYAIGSSPAAAAPTVEAGEVGPERLAALVDRLAAPGWSSRESAHRTLEAAGRAALDSVRAAATEAGDPEARFRAADLVFEVESHERLIAWKARIDPAWLQGRLGLLERLSHRNPTVRLSALGSLRDVPDDAVLALFRDLLADRDARVAFVAATSLLARGDRSGIAQIRLAVSGPNVDDRLAALRALADHGGDEDVPAIELALADTNGQVRAAAVGALVLRLGDAAIPKLEKVLADDDEQVRLAIVRFVAERKDQEAARDLLVRFIDDDNAEIRNEVLNAIIGLRGENIARAIAQALDDPEPANARRAAQALVNLAKTADGLDIPDDALAKVYEKVDDNTRFHILQIAHKRGRGATSTALLIQMCKDEVDQISYPAWQKLLNQAGPADADGVAELLELEDAEKRLWTTQILRDMKHRRTIPALLKAAADEDDDVRRMAFTALKTLDWPETTAGVIVIAATRTGKVRADANGFLAAMRPDAYLEAMVGLLRHDRAEVRRFSFMGLVGSSNDTFGFDADADPAVREPAVRKFESWWFKRKNPGFDRDVVLRDLVGKNPTKRFKASEVAGKLLGDDAVLAALVDALARERVGWVEAGLIAALRNLSGEDFGWKQGLKKLERAKVKAAWKTWHDSR